MKPEGMNRREIFKGGARKDVEARELDDYDAIFVALKKRVVQELLHVDQQGKALTGRKIYQYDAESGIHRHELFPEGSRILNIGDPWQVLDEDGVVNLEYETGEEADFVQNKEHFFDSFAEEIASMQRGIERIRSREHRFGDALAWRVGAVKEYARNALLPDDYLRQSKVLYDVTRMIAEHHGNDDGAGDARELWYAAMRLARGFEDLYYVQTVIEPTVARETVRRRGLAEEDREALVSRLIEEFRGQKKYKHAELVKGAFPDTPFEDHGFDRITASWSVSAHMFGVMNAQQFRVVWREFDRILTKEGAAYIWPISYGARYSDDMAKTLREHRANGGDVGCISWENGGLALRWIDESNNDMDFAEVLQDTQTLVFLPKGTTRAVKERVEQSLYAAQDTDEQAAA